VTPALASLHQTLKLLADPTRLRLVALLSAEELAVQELVGITASAQSRISSHLALLKRAGVVRDRKEGTWSFHSLVPLLPDGPLTPAMFDAAVRPYLDSPAGREDLARVERIREQRRQRSRATHDRLAERWVERAQEFTQGSLRAQACAALLPATATVADLGCGAGYLSSFLLAQGVAVIAVDHSQQMLATARRGLRGRIEFRQGELDRLPIGDREVDAAVAQLVWHHLPGFERAAGELFRIVRPGSAVVVTDLLPHDQDWMRDEMGDLRLGVKPDVVVAALAKAGFVEIEVRDVADRYVVSSAAGARAELALFLVRARRPAAQA
jgi:ArsR family transcriptional regulator